MLYKFGTVEELGRIKARLPKEIPTSGALHGERNGDKEAILWITAKVRFFLGFELVKEIEMRF